MARARLPVLLRPAGLEIDAIRSHGFVETAAASYMLTVVDRGADLLCADGELGPDAAASLKAEARRGVEAGSFFGHIAYGKVIARRSAAA